MTESTSFRPIIDPLQGLLDGKVIFTTPVIEPMVSPDERVQLDKKFAKFTYLLPIGLLGLVAGILHFKLLAFTFFIIFVVLLFVYIVILGPLFSKKVEAHVKKGVLEWKKDHFMLQLYPNASRKIAYNEVKSVQRIEGIPHHLFSRSRHPEKDMISIIFTLILLDEEKIVLELFYQSKPTCLDTLQSVKWLPLTEQLFQFVFKDYRILDTRALEHGYTP